jgi:2-iminobutanoate/2-iminopropanoate deaminase
MIRTHASAGSLAAAMKRYGLQNAAAIQVGEVVFLSGLTAVDPDTGELIDGDIRAHARQTLELFASVLGDIGLSLDHVVKVSCFLADPEADFEGWNEVFKEVFSDPHPCRTTVGAPLVFGRIELDLTASVHTRREGLA